MVCQSVPGDSVHLTSNWCGTSFVAHVIRALTHQPHTEADLDHWITDTYMFSSHGVRLKGLFGKYINC